MNKATIFNSKFLLTSIILFFNSTAFCQDSAPKFGKIKAEDFALKSPVIDSGSNAVIVFDKGDISFEGNTSGWFSYIFKRSKRILVLNKKGFDLATEKVLLYNNQDIKETVEDLVGTTYNIENGAVSETKLNVKDIFDEKSDKNHSYKKFTMPAVKEGSIIEYSYTIKSDYIFQLPAWEFQSALCPTLWSEYNITIPNMLSYALVSQGYHKFDIDKSGEGMKSYSVRRQTKDGAFGTSREEALYVSSPTTTHRWVIKNVPVLNVENYVFSPNNFIDRISLQLSRTYDGEEFHDVANNWKKVNEELRKSDDFGEPVYEENLWLDKVLTQVIHQDDNLLKKAKDIYYYVQKNYTCTNYDDKYIKTSLQDVVKKKSGTVGDINLLLIAMLNHESIQALPVLLSTREAGRNFPSYPVMERLNYVIGKIRISSTDYYLDATVPFLPFGKLPLDCYNGYARVVSPDSAAVYFEPDSLKETHVVSAFIFNGDGKNLEGSLTNNMGFFESLKTKTNIAQSTLDKYEKDLEALYPESMPISNIKVDSLTLPEQNVSVKFDFKLNSFDDADIVYFNPLLGEALMKNLFYAAERQYPVEMPYLKDEIYLLDMEIPKGYAVDEIPKSTRVMLNDTEGSFEYITHADADKIQLRCRLLVNKVKFLPEDYQTLRDFYGFIVKKEAEQIVFKKIK